MSQRPAQPPLEAVGYGAQNRLVVVLVYATFAGLWVLLSDEVVTWLFSDPASVALASTLKGMAFVTVTSLLLYLLLRRRDGGADGERPRLQPGWPFALMAGAIVAFIAAGILRDYDNQRRTEVKQLQTVAELKTRQIADWLAERHREAEFVATSSYYALQYRRWQIDRDGAAGQELQARLRKFLHARGFSHVSLLDPAGRLLWSTHAEQIVPTPALLAAVRIAASTRQVARSEPYVQADARPRLDFVVPLATTGTGAPPTVVVHAYLDSWLYPTLQSWPVPSASGETLIVRRDGDRVLFLNDLRHQSGTALRMRLPLTERDLPAARALRGEVRPGEAMEGRDYRGVAVLAVAHAVPDSDWFLVAKVDRAELIGHALRSATWLGLAGLLALVILAGSLVLVRQRGQLILAAGIREAQAERLRALNLLAAIADSSEDAIYAKDLEGRYVLFNRAASRFVGKTMEEVLGRDDRALFPAAQAEQLMDLGRRVVAENRAITDEDTLTTPVGERVFLATKAPLYDGDGHIIGIYGISRDITERKLAELAQAEREARYRAVIESTPDGFWVVDASKGRIQTANAAYVRLSGYSLDELRDMPVAALDVQESQDDVRAHIQRIMREGSAVFESQHRTKDGRFWPVEVAVSYWPEGGYMFAFLRDISARKTAEKALRDAHERQRTLFDTLPDLVWLKDADGVYLACNRRFETFFGAPEADIVGRTDYDFLPRAQADFFRANDQAAISADRPLVNEEEVTFASDGHREILHTIKTPLRDSEGWLVGVLGIARDITGIKAGEAALKARNDQLERFNCATVGRELDMLEMKKSINALSRELGREAPYPLAFLKDGEGEARP